MIHLICMLLPLLLESSSAAAVRSAPRQSPLITAHLAEIAEMNKAISGGLLKVEPGTLQASRSPLLQSLALARPQSIHDVMAIIAPLTHAVIDGTNETPKTLSGRSDAELMAILESAAGVSDRSLVHGQGDMASTERRIDRLIRLVARRLRGGDPSVEMIQGVAVFADMNPERLRLPSAYFTRRTDILLGEPADTWWYRAESAFINGAFRRNDIFRHLDRPEEISRTLGAIDRKLIGSSVVPTPFMRAQEAFEDNATVATIVSAPLKYFRLVDGYWKTLTSPAPSWYKARAIAMMIDGVLSWDRFLALRDRATRLWGDVSYYSLGVAAILSVFSFLSRIPPEQANLFSTSDVPPELQRVYFLVLGGSSVLGIIAAAIRLWLKYSVRFSRLNNALREIRDRAAGVRL